MLKMFCSYDISGGKYTLASNEFVIVNHINYFNLLMSNNILDSIRIYSLIMICN